MRVTPRVSGDGLGSLLAFAADSKTLLVNAENIRGQPEFSLFDATSGARLGVADQMLHPSTPTAVHLGPGGSVTAVGVAASRRALDTLLVINTTLGQDARSRHYKDGNGLFGITSLAFSPDNQRLAVTDSASVFVWDLPTGAHRKIFGSRSNPIRTVRFSADGKAILASDPSGVTIWDAGHGKERAHLDYGSIGADGKSVFVSKGIRAIAVFSASVHLDCQA